MKADRVTRLRTDVRAALGREAAILRVDLTASKRKWYKCHQLASQKPTGRIPGCLASQAFVKWEMLPKIIAVQKH